jgi:hypothetical protein
MVATSSPVMAGSCRTRQLQIVVEWSYRALLSTEAQQKTREAFALLSDQQFKAYVITPPQGNVYTQPPGLRRVEFAELFELGHCDLYLMRE